MRDLSRSQTYSTLILSRQVQHSITVIVPSISINNQGTHLISPFQCGFRSNNSTEFAAAAFSDFIGRGMDQGLLTDAVFIDLRKAFDSFDHDLLNRMDLRTVN